MAPHRSTESCGQGRTWPANRAAGSIAYAYGRPLATRLVYLFGISVAKKKYDLITSIKITVTCCP